MPSNKKPQQQTTYTKQPVDLSIHCKEVADGIRELRELYRSENIEHYVQSLINEHSGLINYVCGSNQESVYPLKKNYTLFIEHILQLVGHHREITFNDYNRLRTFNHQFSLETKSSVSSTIQFIGNKLLIPKSVIKSFLLSTGYASYDYGEKSWDIKKEIDLLKSTNKKNSEKLLSGDYSVYKGVFEKYEAFVVDAVSEGKEILHSENFSSGNTSPSLIQSYFSKLLDNYKLKAINELMEFAEANNTPNNVLKALFDHLKIDIVALTNLKQAPTLNNDNFVSKLLLTHHFSIASKIIELREIYNTSNIDKISKKFASRHYEALDSNRQKFPSLLEIYEDFFSLFFKHFLQGMPNNPRVEPKEYNLFRNKVRKLEQHIVFETSLIIGFAANRSGISNSVVQGFLTFIGVHFNYEVDSVNDIINETEKIYSYNAKNHIALQSGDYTYYKGILEEYDRIKQEVLNNSKSIFIDKKKNMDIENYRFKNVQEQLEQLMLAHKQSVKNELEKFNTQHNIKGALSQSLFKNLGLDIVTLEPFSVNEKLSTERESMDDNSKTEALKSGYSSVVKDALTLAGQPRVRAPKGEGRKKKPVTFTLYEPDIELINEASSLLGFKSRTDYIESILKKHAQDVVNELKKTPSPK